MTAQIIFFYLAIFIFGFGVGCVFMGVLMKRRIDRAEDRYDRMRRVLIERND